MIDTNYNMIYFQLNNAWLIYLGNENHQILEKFLMVASSRQILLKDKILLYQVDFTMIFDYFEKIIMFAFISSQFALKKIPDFTQEN